MTTPTDQTNKISWRFILNGKEYGGGVTFDQKIIDAGKVGELVEKVIDQLRESTQAILEGQG